MKDGVVLIRLAREVSSLPLVQELGASNEVKLKTEESGFSRNGYLYR